MLYAASARAAPSGAMLRRMEPTSVHSYGEHADQHIDVYRTRVPFGHEPVVVVVHGGYWRHRVSSEAILGVVSHLLKAGYDVVNVEYRRGPGEGAWPIPRDDVRAAMAAARQHFDDRTLIGLGHSVGGQLVLLASEHLDAIVALAPVTDAVRVQTEGLGDGAADEYFLTTPAETAPLYADASPVRQPAPDCPTLLVQGLLDDRVPASHSFDYAAAHPQAPIDLIIDHGANHAQVAEPDHQVWRLVEAWLGRFDRA